MNVLKIGAINGVTDRLQLCNKDNLEGVEYLKNDYLDTNSYFWNEQLKESKINNCISFITQSTIQLPTEILWVLNNNEQFILKLRKAKDAIKNPFFSSQELFACLETLQIACELIYYADTVPFKLNVASGFMQSNESAKEMLEGCLHYYCNPYLSFIINCVMPLISNYFPDIILLEGKPNIATFAIAVLARKIFPDLKIGIYGHSSEYYSLNKIIHLLLKNRYLFSVFDFIIKDYDTDTIIKLCDTLESGGELQNIPNLIYTPDRGKTIYQNSSECTKNTELQISSSYKPIDIKLFPNNHCFWNKCSFCGINSKYITSEDHKSWDLNKAFQILEHLNLQGIKKIWLIDEAIPTDILNSIAQKINEKNWHFEWHVRTRIDKKLLKSNVCENLANSGLKHILLGLESASDRILKLMNKTKDDDYIETAELIVKKFTENNISVHFPAIIGFPTETDDERDQTINFLKYLRDTYSLFTYNVNILELDVSSDLYKNFEKYDICNLFYPCTPSSFIGNSIQWGNDISVLKEIQKEALYYLFPWYPNSSLLKIDFFYKYLEYTRMPLNNKNWDKMHTFRTITINSDKICINDYCDMLKLKNGKYALINHNTYQFVIGGEILNQIFNYKKWILCKDIIYKFPERLRKNVLDLLQCLLNYQIIKIRR